MDNFASFVNKFYLAGQGAVFKATKRSPEKAHELLVKFLRTNYRMKVHKWYERKHKPSNSTVRISTAAGFNKNGEIPPCLLRLLGFDRVVVGTVTGRKWEGNPKPRCVRFEKTHSMVNWLGLPNLGAKVVRKYLDSYDKDLNPHITLNLSPTPEPGLSIEEKINDIRHTLGCMQGFDPIDRFELNVSCPNIAEHGSNPFCRQLECEIVPMIQSIRPFLSDDEKELYLKISPDMGTEELTGLLDAIAPLPVRGLTACNTSTLHDPEWIPDSPGTGGASGEAVYLPSRKVQEFLSEKKPKELNVIACGGINSRGKVRYLNSIGINEFQIYTPLVFQGFNLAEQLRL